MGSLSDLIGGKHKAVPTSSSSSFGTSRSSGSSTSAGSSSSFGRSGTTVFSPEFFEQLFGNASGAAQRVASAVPGLQGQAAMLFNSGAGFLEQLEGPLATEERLADTGNEEEQIGLLGSDLGRFFDEQINPRLTSRGVATGTLGGSRGEVARGVATRGLGEEFARGSAAIRAAGTQRRDALATSADATRGSRLASGLSALPSMFGLAEAGANAEMAPWLVLSQILGDRTLLSSSETGSESSELARAISESFGEQRSSSSGSTITKGPGLLDVANSFANVVGAIMPG